MKKLIAVTAAVITAAALVAVGGCGDPANEPHAPEYTVDETLATSGKDPNAAEFYASAVQKVEGHALAGKTIYWLGSSVTYGASSDGEAMGEYLAAKTGCISRKDAVSGTTIFDDNASTDTGVNSYTRRLVNSTVFDKDEHVDAFICQISTNDARNDRLSKRGAMTAADVDDKYAFDLKTTLGGVEYILAYVSETWGCPVYFYSGSYFGDTGSGARTNGNPTGTNYAALVSQVKAVVEKWQALGYVTDVIDMYNDADFNAAVSDDYYAWCTSDAIHPRKAGYLNWWMPYFESFLLDNLK